MNNAGKPIIVQKFGGSSVATTEMIRQVADQVVKRQRAGNKMVVVVSAMGDATDELLARAKDVSDNPDRRELDMLLSVGERISMSLLAMAIRAKGQKAISLTGSQSGIITTASHANARIMEVRPFRVQDELERGRIVIVAGYQGVSYKRDITTLGRGGSDTTAVALAAALDADACEIYSNVNGIMTADPQVVPDAVTLPEISYEEMQALASAGARVLNAQAVEFAKSKGIAIYARKTGAPHPGTVVRRDLPAPNSGVRSIASDDRIGIFSGTIDGLDRLDSLVQALGSLGADIKALETRPEFQSQVVTGLVGLEDVTHEPALAQEIEAILGKGAYQGGRGTVTLVGDGIGAAAGSAALAALASAELRPLGIAISPFQVRFMVGRESVSPTTRCLHGALVISNPSAEAVIG